MIKDSCNGVGGMIKDSCMQWAIDMIKAICNRVGDMIKTSCNRVYINRWGELLTCTSFKKSDFVE